jgi:DNA polymerase V
MADPPPPASGTDTTNRSSTDRSAAGPPADLARLLIRDPGHTVLLRVAGASMQGAGIHHGDLLVVDCRRRARVGQVVVALVEGGFTLKRLAWRDGHWWLDAAHPAYPALALGEGRIWGVAVHAIRALHGIGPRRR